MHFEHELSYFCRVLEKLHLNSFFVEVNELGTPSFEAKLHLISKSAVLFSKHLSAPLPYTLYRISDSFECSYLFLLLPDVQPATLFGIGPFLRAPLTEQSLLELGEANGILPSKQRHLKEYFAGLTVLNEGAPISVMFNTLCEHIWDKKPYTMLDFNALSTVRDGAADHFLSNAEEETDTLLSIRAVERRYAFENEMIRAVSLGQAQNEDRFRNAFSNDLFERRAKDPLRNAKNYAIIMNTLLRKAAEKGGVHPLYIDRTSSDFAHRIEDCPTLSDCTALMNRMFRAYCRLVRKHSVQKYSPVVQKAVLTIESDLSLELSSGVLAHQQGISTGYLSGVFKKETGKTVSEYIRERRMDFAAHLLESTELQVQTVAQHCGMMDLQYFTKVFKKHFGQTPSDFRKQIKK